MPKPADKVQGHRARPVVKDPVVQAPEVQRTPDPKADWLDSTKTAWAVYWRSDVARIVLDVDAPSIFRLFSLYDQHERSMDVVRMALVVKGSTGQIRTNPLADHAMAWTLPTLGWGVLEWMASYLPSPRDAAMPLILTDEQAEYVLAWYAVDKAGRFIYRRSISERAKGWGKSPLHGAIALAELGGGSVEDSAPVRFDGWRGKEPVGRPWGTKGDPRPWAQIAAVSEDQTDNTYSALYEMLTANDHKAAKALRIDDGRTRLYLVGRPGTLEPVTASAGSREGQPITYGLLDETHLYTRKNGGVKLAATLRRNVAKMGGRSQETTNAPMLGEGSVAEQSGRAVDRGFSGILWDAKRPELEPEPEWTDEQLLEALARGVRRRLVGRPQPDPRRCSRPGDRLDGRAQVLLQHPRRRPVQGDRSQALGFARRPPRPAAGRLVHRARFRRLDQRGRDGASRVPRGWLLVPRRRVGPARGRGRVERAAPRGAREARVGVHLLQGRPHVLRPAQVVDRGRDVAGEVRQGQRGRAAGPRPGHLRAVAHGPGR
jgi:hypothetical protein